MATPHFTLQPVLSVKESLLEELRFELAKLLHIQADAATVLTALQAERQRGDVVLAGARQRGVLRLEELRRYEAYIERLEIEITRQRRVLAEFDRQVDALRERVSDALKEVKVLARLKERAAAARQRELAVADAKFNDDLAISQYYRRRHGDATVEQAGT
ncbi:MAG: flagellar export protein FliJ [Chloroflexi bacterium]|nr:flagellar export protein FliJ [Chloroflexota bacterium]